LGDVPQVHVPPENAHPRLLIQNSAYETFSLIVTLAKGECPVGKTRWNIVNPMKLLDTIRRHVD